MCCLLASGSALGMGPSAYLRSGHFTRAFGNRRSDTPLLFPIEHQVRPVDAAAEVNVGVMCTKACAVGVLCREGDCGGLGESICRGAPPGPYGLANSNPFDVY
jgi:hypothetical protein